MKKSKVAYCIYIFFCALSLSKCGSHSNSSLSPNNPIANGLLDGNWDLTEINCLNMHPRKILSNEGMTANIHNTTGSMVTTQSNCSINT